jgi:hypothetical protein
MRLTNKAERFSGGIPSDFSFVFFRPPLVLARYPKGKHLNATARLVAFFQNFVVWIRADRPLAHLADDTGLFERFPCGRVVWRHPALGPTFRNDPTPRPARRHQHDFQSGLAIRAIWQSGVLKLPARFPLPAFARAFLCQWSSVVRLCSSRSNMQPRMNHCKYLSILDNRQVQVRAQIPTARRKWPPPKPPPAT